MDSWCDYHNMPNRHCGHMNHLVFIPEADPELDRLLREEEEIERQAEINTKTNLVINRPGAFGVKTITITLENGSVIKTKGRIEVEF